MGSSRRYAVYGGSFDPVHKGHMALADCAVRECAIDELIFMPAYMSPFKQDRKVTDGSDRLAMLKAVLRYNEAFRVSDYELSKGGPSYTVETLAHMSRELGTRPSFILGFDSLVQLDSWYMGESIIRDYPLICAKRPDTEDREGLKKIEFYRKEYGADIRLLGMQPVDASSTEIRKRIKEGRPLDGLVAPEVEGYIIEHKLYR